MTLLPIFLQLAGRRCLLVGAGNVALEKIGTLLQTGLQLRVVSPEARPEIAQLAAEGKLEWVKRCFEDADIDGNFVVIAATDKPEVNAAVHQGCVARNILSNSVDDIPNCDFFFGSVVSRGPLQVAISTAGQSPAFAQRLRRELDEQLPQQIGPWLEELGSLRREVLDAQPRTEERKLLLHQLAQMPVCGAVDCPSRQIAFSEAATTSAENVAEDGYYGPTEDDPDEGPGWPPSDAPLPASAETVYLVGAGPGDPDLLTVKAVRLLQTADVILHDDLVPQAILDLASPSAEVVNVGKRCGNKSITQQQIHEMMTAHAGQGRCVVRLKSGDPLLFGRAAEEMAALAAAQVPFEVVPGITSAFAAAAALGCSLTERNCASSVIFSTGHHALSQDQSTLPQIENATRVVYMPGRDLNLLAEEWLAEGLPANLPCAIVSCAAQPAQHIRWTTLGGLGEASLTPEAAPAPSLLIAGWAIAASAAKAAAAVGNVAATA